MCFIMINKEDSHNRKFHSGKWRCNSLYTHTHTGDSRRGQHVWSGGERYWLSRAQRRPGVWRGAGRTSRTIWLRTRPVPIYILQVTRRFVYNVNVCARLAPSYRWLHPAASRVQITSAARNSSLLIKHTKTKHQPHNTPEHAISIAFNRKWFKTNKINNLIT